MNPYLLLGALIMVLVACVTGYAVGGKHMKNALQAEQADVLRNAIIDTYRQAKEQDAADHEVQASFETARETVRTVYIKVKEKTDENIALNNGYGDCSLDDDGLRLYNTRPNTSSPPASGIADVTLPGFAGRSGRQAGDPPQEQPGALGPLLRMPGETQVVSGMGQTTTRQE